MIYLENASQSGPRLGVPPFRRWHHRPRSPGLQWHKNYTGEGLHCGRVLMIDYVRKDHTKEGMRKVATEEIGTLDGLQRVYNSPERNQEAVLRVFHVQNAHWATHFLLWKFGIDSKDDPIGTGFGNWIKDRTERRSARPSMNGKTWRTQHDPWRGISRTAFGVDYLKPYPTSDLPRDQVNSRRDQHVRRMELNCFDDDNNPMYGWDAYVQRVGVYIQRKEIAPLSPPDVPSPYEDMDPFDSEHQRQEHRSRVASLDNGNVIIIIENSQSRSIKDTMIPARGSWESRWRRLPFYLAFESHDISNDENLTIECMKLVLQDLFKALVESWETLLDICYTHVSILEDKIYEQPADESRAPELFTNSSMFLKVEKLMFLHIEVVKEMQSHLFELIDDGEVENNWLDASPADFERLNNLVQEDLVKPTANLADLMYKSVGIRDSRHSLQLGTSMWRLSWITFIFLPLTFMVGFFGMNVDTFHNDPSIKWYFITAVPFMLLIVVFYFVIKHYWTRSRQSPYQRGVYEHLFHDLSNTYPTYWTRAGPRQGIVPSGFFNRIRWRLIKRWANPSKTIERRPYENDEDVDDVLGSFSRLKRYWMRKWTDEIEGRQEEGTESLMERGSTPAGPTTGATTTMLAANNATELVSLSNGGGKTTTGVASAPTFSMTTKPDKEQAQQQEVPLFNVLLKLPPPPSSSSPRQSVVSSRAEDRRPGSPASAGNRNSGVLVEEKEMGWLKTL